MSDRDRVWLDRVAGERMRFDSEFSEVIAESPFSSQQWGLVMTAAEFHIQNPSDPDTAELVADASKLPAIMGELDNLDQGMAQAGGGRPGEGSGIVDSIRDRLGMGDGGDEELRAAAEELLEEYADGFQERLVAADRWAEVCGLAADGNDYDSNS